MLALGVAGIVIRALQTDILGSVGLPSVWEWERILDSSVVAWAAVCISASVVLFVIAAVAGSRNARVKPSAHARPVEQTTSGVGRAVSRPRNTPGQNVYSGGIGVVIGVVLFIWIQTAIDQASANGDTISDQAWSNLTWWRVAAVLFIVAGGYYLAKGLLAQSKTRETMQVDPNMTPLVECPYCRELVREGAVKCKHCSSGLE